MYIQILFDVPVITKGIFPVRSPVRSEGLPPFRTWLHLVRPLSCKGRRQKGVTTTHHRGPRRPHKTEKSGDSLFTLNSRPGDSPGRADRNWISREPEVTEVRFREDFRRKEPSGSSSSVKV